MAVTTKSVVKVGGTTWRYSWTGGTSPYRLVRDGLTIVQSTTATQHDVFGDSSYEPPIVEILDATETTALGETHPPYVDIQWRGYSTAEYYAVKRSGVLQENVLEQGLGYYLWTGEAEADGASYEYTVTAVDSEGNTSPVATNTGTMIRYPDAPSVQFGYSGGNLTVSARA